LFRTAVESVLCGRRSSGTRCLALRERRELHPLDDDHPLDGGHIHIRCDVVIKEIAEERRPVTEVDVSGEEAGGRVGGGLRDSQ
jgi:hypothetical protein